MPASKLAKTAAKTNFPRDIKASWWNLIGFLLNWTFLLARLGNTSDQLELLCIKPELIDLSQDKQTCWVIIPGLKIIHIVQRRVERLRVLICMCVCVYMWGEGVEANKRTLVMSWRKYDHLPQLSVRQVPTTVDRGRSANNYWPLWNAAQCAHTHTHTRWCYVIVPTLFFLNATPNTEDKSIKKEDKRVIWKGEKTWKRLRGCYWVCLERRSG